MSIYDVNGIALIDPYNLSESIDVAYDIDGNEVFTRTPPQPPQWDYDSYTIENMFSFAYQSMQGFAVYNGKIAQVRENVSLYIIDIPTKTKVKEVTMDMGHGNSCQFGSEFYAESDEFPLFYIRNSGVWVYRIVGTSSTLITKYSFPSSLIGTYVAGFGFDDTIKRFYTASYTEGDYTTKTGLLRICEWDMDDLTDNGDGTYTMALLSSNDFTWFNRYEAVQGCCYHDGYLFIASGYTGNTQQDVVLVDTSTLSIAHTVSLGASAEVEGCAWVNNEYMIVGQKVNGYTYRKITFGTL